MKTNKKQKQTIVAPAIEKIENKYITKRKKLDRDIFFALAAVDVDVDVVIAVAVAVTANIHDWFSIRSRQ